MKSICKFLCDRAGSDMKLESGAVLKRLDTPPDFAVTSHELFQRVEKLRGLPGYQRKMIGPMRQCFDTMQDCRSRDQQPGICTSSQSSWLILSSAKPPLSRSAEAGFQRQPISAGGPAGCGIALLISRPYHGEPFARLLRQII